MMATPEAAHCAELESLAASLSLASESHLKEPFVGNVSKVSPHHGGTSKRSKKKGYLIFDACFEEGLCLLLRSPSPFFEYDFVQLCRQPWKSGLNQ